MIKRRREKRGGKAAVDGSRGVVHRLESRIQEKVT